MIRLPVTSISLSEDDLQLHFRQIDNYQALLLQGFKKKEIVRYYNQQNDAQQRDVLLGQHLGPPAADQLVSVRCLDVLPSCVELYTRRPSLPVLNSRSSHTKVATTSQPISSCTAASAQLNDMACIIHQPEDAFPRTSVASSEQPVDQDSEDVNRQGILRIVAHSTDDDVHSSSPVNSTNRPVRHAPRQSSLLRFARTAASPQPSAHSDSSIAAIDESSLQGFLHSVDYIVSPSCKARSYRPRTDTYSYVSSAAETDDGLQIAGGLEDEFAQLSLHRHETQKTYGHEVVPRRSQHTSSLHATNPLERPSVSSSSPLRAEADTFVPSMLPPPFSATRRASSNQDNLPSTIRNSSLNSLSYDFHPHSTTFSHIHTPVRRTSVGRIAFAATAQSEPTSPSDLPSSPPAHSPQTAARSSPSVLLPSLPALTPPARTAREPRTEPRHQRHRYLDGPSFTVYNDAMPSESQPQTPADLQRRPTITEFNAVYTAPPGVIRSTHSLRQTRPHAEPGEQSPTIRAIGMRERRHRELWRSVRVERERSARLRELDSEAWARQAWTATHEHEHAMTNAWRDDLDADRVGEENFEDEEGGGRAGSATGNGRTNRRA